MAGAFSTDQEKCSYASRYNQAKAYLSAARTAADIACAHTAEPQHVAASPSKVGLQLCVSSSSVSVSVLAICPSQDNMPARNSFPHLDFPAQKTPRQTTTVLSPAVFCPSLSLSLCLPVAAV